MEGWLTHSSGMYIHLAKDNNDKDFDNIAKHTSLKIYKNNE